jgi:hypothetical protein
MYANRTLSLSEGSVCVAGAILLRVSGESCPLRSRQTDLVSFEITPDLDTHNQPVDEPDGGDFFAAVRLAD